MLASDAVLEYGMSPHEENGRYVERHYASSGDARPASGSIYYYLAPDEISEYHTIDCDEYWVHVVGAPLDIWCVSPSGELEIEHLGVGPGLEPLAYLPAGSVFGARGSRGAQDGTMIVCITVPRFDYKGWRLVPRDELEQLCPEALGLYAR